MYSDFYGFQDRPFNLTPDPRFIFLSRNHREAIAHLLYGINNHVGFISLTGEVGSGKTTVLRTLLSHLESDQYRTALVFNPSLSPSGLLRSIGREFGIVSDLEDEADNDILDKLNRFLIRENAQKRTVVLVIDEAQNLGAKVLEQIRLISNLETNSDKLIQIILAGQPELLDLLKKRNLRQLSQRITVRYHLKPLDFNDTKAYIDHRLEVSQGRVSFSSRAVAKVYRYSGGLPRLINAACDRALLAGYTREAGEITGRIAAVGIRDLAKQGSRPALMRPAFYPLAVLLIFLAAAPFVLDMTALSSAVLDPFYKEAVVVGPPAAAPAAVPAAIPEQQVKAAPAEPGRDTRSWLEQISENESLRRAFNELAPLWKAEPIPEEGFDPEGFVPSLKPRGLNLISFSGDLDSLKKIDCPAILELAFPGKEEKRYAALIGVRGDKMVPDLKEYWTGQAYIPWKNFLQLPERFYPGSRGKETRLLKQLLRETGIHLAQGDTYDKDTQAAVKIFQAAYGLEMDGIVGNRTMLVLYRSIDRFEIPRLKRIDNHEPHS
ncbi:MAG: AAA family ATPase [Syntrophales bacterium]|nr:AAA family ATPase [Syntrophales bacterium]